jgi:pimeloyl-ACP methyl ester carboxylesterase
VPFIESSDGVRLAYDIEGQGPPLVLHLGAGCDSGLWRAAGYVAALAPSYTCILFDHRGHGASDKPRLAHAYHIERLTDDVVDLLDHLDLGTVAFWGYSSGISPGIRLAERYPARLWGLVASGAVAPPDPPDELAAWSKQAAADFRSHGWEELIARFETQEPDPIPAWMTDRIRATDIDQYVRLIECYPEWHWEEWDALPGIDTPTLFLTGELEDPDDNVAAIVGRMRRAELLRLPRLGHINAFLATDVVLDRVRPFLAEHAPQNYDTVRSAD